jgi:hypothetical protein
MPELSHIDPRSAALLVMDYQVDTLTKFMTAAQSADAIACVPDLMAMARDAGMATERGRAGYDKYRHDFSKLIWRIASPKWDFDDATFDRSAASFDNPDHVAIVIHNYRFRLDLAKGEPKYDGLEIRFAEAPDITVPTITLEGDANGAPHADPSRALPWFESYADQAEL